MKENYGRSGITGLLTNIIVRAALRSLRYLSWYFSFCFCRGPLFILARCSEELVGEGKALPEAPEPELEEVLCCGEPRKDWAVKACRACCLSSSVYEGEGRQSETEA